ncbi:hypothetical protein BDR22DRAFT_959297 [Usnea florida]
MQSAMANNVETQQVVNADDVSNWELAEDAATPSLLPRSPTVPLVLERKEPDCSLCADYLWKLGNSEFDMDFPRLHAMVRWLHEELWECTKNFVLQHNLIERANPFRYGIWSKEVYMVQSLRFKSIDRCELTDWTFLIAHTELPDSAFLDGFMIWGPVDSVKGLLRSADEIRHAAAHHRPVSVGDLAQAMLLPRVLKDTKTADRIEKTFYAICDEAGNFFDESTRMDAEQTIFTLPCETPRQKLARLESLLQSLCFSYAQRKNPNLLSNRSWVVPERVEISKLSGWCFRNPYQDDFPNEMFDDESLPETVVALRQLRNCLWHRNFVSDEGFLYFFHAAVRFAIYTGNRAGSINIEIEVEMMFTGKSREDVLARLHGVYQAEELPADEDDRQRECRRRVAIGKVLEESGIEMSSRETFTNWNYMFQYPRLQREEPYLVEPPVEAKKEPSKDSGDDNPRSAAGKDLKETNPDNIYRGEGHQREDVTWPENIAWDTFRGEGHQREDVTWPENIAWDTFRGEGHQEEDIMGETEYTEPEHADSEHQETAIQETPAQPPDQNPLKELHITVSAIDPSSPPLDSPPLQSEEPFDIEPTSLNHSPTATTPATISQDTPTSVAEGEVGVSIVLDRGEGTNDSPGMKACEHRPRLLTFSPSMHECLKW